MASLLDRLNEFGLTTNLKKCKFGCKEVKFLSHVVTAEELLPARDKIESIRNFEQPKTIKSLRRFIGMAQFYAPSNPNLSRKLVPLYSMIRGKKEPQSALKWTADTTKILVHTKDCFANFNALTFCCA